MAPLAVPAATSASGRELLHLDTKKLGRFWGPGKRVLGSEAGGPQRNRHVAWQHLRVAMDDHSRLAREDVFLGATHVLLQDPGSYTAVTVNDRAHRIRIEHNVAFGTRLTTRITCKSAICHLPA